MRIRHGNYLIGLALILVSLPALAHTGHGGQINAFISGFAHPFGGLDHLLAMLAVGFAAAQMRRALIPLALAFVGFMLLGGLLGLAKLGLPHVETGIALSVLVLGGILMAARQLPLVTGAGLVALFAIFHGQAHSAEMPLGMSPALYFAGFSVGTLGLHLAGYGLGRRLRERSVTWWPKAAGAATAGAGALLLMGV